MKPVLYVKITPADWQSEHETHAVAQRLGYTLTQFNGWDDSDFINRKAEIRQNQAFLNEIMDACTRHYEVDGKRYFDCPQIDQVIPSN